jgi:hypothetical protein
MMELQTEFSMKNISSWRVNDFRANVFRPVYESGYINDSRANVFRPVYESGYINDSRA